MFFLFVVLCVSAVSAQPLAGTRPNILSIILDDVGVYDLNIPELWPLPDVVTETGNTPVIEKLASEGTVFTNVHVYPVCSPSRCALYSGLHPTDDQNSVYAFFDLNHGNDPPSQRYTPPVHNNTLPPTTQTTGSRLKEVGYKTGHVGKYHCGLQPAHWDIGYDINQKYFLPSPIPSLDEYWMPYNESDIERIHGGQTCYTQERLSEILLGTPKLQTDALEAIVEDVIDELASDGPFYVQWHPQVKHKPWTEARPDLEALYTRDERGYALLAGMDQAVARMLAFLESRNLRQNTLIIIMGDNGTNRERVLRGRKGTYYEGGLRVPYIVNMPGTIPANQQRTHPVHSTDILPTIMQLAGVPPDPALPGNAFTEALTDAACSRQTHSMFFHFPGYLKGPSENRAEPTDVIIRDAKCKLMYLYENDTFEMYDLELDPTESTNAMTESTGTTCEWLSLCQELRQWLLDNAVDDNDWMRHKTDGTLVEPFLCE
jgi:arylsulfatase A-like enzyme